MWLTLLYNRKQSELVQIIIKGRAKEIAAFACHVFLKNTADYYGVQNYPSGWLVPTIPNCSSNDLGMDPGSLCYY